MLWFRSPLEPEEVIRRISKVKNTTSFRSTWEYANIPFITRARRRRWWKRSRWPTASRNGSSRRWG